LFTFLALSTAKTHRIEGPVIHLNLNLPAGETGRNSAKENCNSEKESYVE
jgi:hypothetical protein